MEAVSECRRLLLLIEEKMGIVTVILTLPEVELYESGFRYSDIFQSTQQWILVIYRHLTVQVTLIAFATSITASSLGKTSNALFNTTSRKTPYSRYTRNIHLAVPFD